MMELRFEARIVRLLMVPMGTISRSHREASRVIVPQAG